MTVVGGVGGAVGRAVVGAGAALGVGVVVAGAAGRGWRVVRRT